MQVKIENGNLVLTLPLQKPTLSKTGKSKIVATTNGFVSTEVEVEGRNVAVSVNAVIK